MIGIGHPAHVHFYKNFIWDMEKKGHKIRVACRNRKIIVDLLEKYGIKYNKKTTPNINNILNPRSVISYSKYELETYNIVKKFDPDICTGIAMVALSHVSTMLDIPSILFTDTEHANISNKISFPFVNLICTPDCYLDDLGTKQISYPGYHELAYLHPNRFTPDPSVLDYIDADRDDKIVILRLISWEAAHDVGHQGFDNVIDVVHKLESTGARVVITSEGNIPEEIEYCQSQIPVHKMHDLMYYSNLYIGESGTMATEAAILGTPSIRISSVAKLLGNTHELSNKYELLYYYEDEQKALDKGIELLKKNSKESWKEKRDKMLEDKIDVTDFIVWLIEKHPESFKMLKQESNYQQYLKGTF